MITYHLLDDAKVQNDLNNQDEPAVKNPISHDWRQVLYTTTDNVKKNHELISQIETDLDGKDGDWRRLSIIRRQKLINK